MACLLISLFLVCCSNPAHPVPSVANTGVAQPVRLWQDASIFGLVTDLIASAHVRVMVEMYELERADLLQKLGEAVGRGVNVRVITDPTVTVNRHSTAVLDSLGASERVYPVDDRRHQIDHVKLLIADGKAAVGGMNWGNHSDRNHDYVLETRVTVDINRLVRIFEQDWSLAGGHPSPLTAVAGEVAQTAPGAEIRAMLGSALVHAMRRVLAEVYTLTDPEIIAELVDAHRRGATVRVLLDPHQPYNLHGYDVLRAGGVEVRWYPVPRVAKLHAKIGLFDGVLVLGSANWTLSGLGVNHELDIETGDPVAVETYAARFAADWVKSGG
ncbi:MAG TPA: phosphatidylserine/phosphatidylglycerophosphate/cardiolipin synthase family protein [Candidatus Dormibacteraeota bacterium]|nr:phosphatidylserine/phosphatidylglycerophosphate/cardiolipin synthase family protein [Candidatus Dormibacteraeota bacterium]